MKKSFFKCALIILSIAAFQACNETPIEQDILDPDIPLNVDVNVTPETAAEESATSAGASIERGVNVTLENMYL